MHMDLFDLFEIISFAAPAFSAFVCLSLLLLRYKDRDEHTRIRLLKLLILYYILFFANSLFTIFFMYMKNIYIYTGTFAFLTLLLSEVIFYKIIFIVTSVTTDEKFSRKHYIIPVVLSAVHGIWSLFVPFNIQYQIVASNILDIPDYKWFLLFFASKFWIFIIYSIIYAVLSIIRIHKYRKSIIDYSADEERSSLRWLYTLLAITFFLMPFYFISPFISEDNVLHRLLPAISNFMLIFQNVILCYNMFIDNYVIMLPEGLEKKESKSGGKNNEQEKPAIAEKVDKKRFEEYIKKNKPYLNPKLKITDLTLELNTNRTYLSAFINTNYGMNFSSFINQCRMQEMDMLSKDPAYSSYKEIEIAYIAGFSDYRSLKNIKKEINR